MKRRAFTLIELLVVIAVITLLLMIAAPALLRAREEGRAIVCRNNLKQMGLAAGTYTSDYDGSYPLSQYTWIGSASVALTGDSEDPVSDPLPEVHFFYGWDFTISQEAGQRKIAPGLLWQTETPGQVQQCPSYKSEGVRDEAPFIGYNYNTSYIGHGEGERINPDWFRGKVIDHPQMPFTKIVMPARAQEVQSPGLCVLFGDGQYSGGANKFMRSPRAWEGDYDMMIRVGGTQGYRHSGKTQVGWCDGHVTAQKERYTDSVAGIQMQLDQYNQRNKVKIGFLSPDNRLYDLK
jgi:prepilin-type N-terminal cleavage/methylation domain-containing protein/prepilin-type processing-associated H-X9-DG protein